MEVHAADEARLELSADGPVDLDVRYELTVDDTGAELPAPRCPCGATAGLTGRLVANATAALLSAGALERAAGPDRPGRESQQPALLAA